MVKLAPETRVSSHCEWCTDEKLASESQRKPDLERCCCLGAPGNNT